MISISNYNIHLKSGKCSYCENQIVFHRRHSGEYLCPKCFERNIEKIISKTVSKYKMLSPHDKIVVGLTMDDIDAGFLADFFGKDFKVKKDKKIINILQSITDEEALKFAKIKGLKFKVSDKHKKIKDFLKKISKKHPEVRFNLLKNVKKVEEL